MYVIPSLSRNLLVGRTLSTGCILGDPSTSLRFAQDDIVGYIITAPHFSPFTFHLSSYPSTSTVAPSTFSKRPISCSESPLRIESVIVHRLSNS